MKSGHMFIMAGCMFFVLFCFFSRLTLPQKYIRPVTASALSPQRACSAVVFLLSACSQRGKIAELHDIKRVIVRMIIN